MTWQWKEPGWLCKYRISILNTSYNHILFAHNIFDSCPIVVKFRTKHDSDIPMFCVKFQNDWTVDIDVMDKWDFARFDF